MTNSPNLNDISLVEYQKLIFTTQKNKRKDQKDLQIKKTIMCSSTLQINFNVTYPKTNLLCFKCLCISCVFAQIICHMRRSIHSLFTPLIQTQSSVGTLLSHTAMTYNCHGIKSSISLQNFNFLQTLSEWTVTAKVLYLTTHTCLYFRTTHKLSFHNLDLV